jgi:hypothetical protein
VPQPYPVHQRPVDEDAHQQSQRDSRHRIDYEQHCGSGCAESGLGESYAAEQQRRENEQRYRAVHEECGLEQMGELREEKVLRIGRIGAMPRICPRHSRPAHGIGRWRRCRDAEAKHRKPYPTHDIGGYEYSGDDDGEQMVGEP